MKGHFLALVAATALAVGATVVIPSLAAAQTSPLMGGGYRDIIPIPVNDPTTKLTGALYKPVGAGPFPAVVYMRAWGVENWPPETALEKALIDHLLARGVATFIGDPLESALSAVKVLEAMPDIDPNRVFLQGYSCGAVASLYAVDTTTTVTDDTKIAGVIAFFPKCYHDVDPSVPTLGLIGEKDFIHPAALCQAVKDKPNFEVVVFPGATAGFVYPNGQPLEYGSEPIVYDVKAALEAQRRIDAFMAAHMSSK
jgi:dienelactone hydrolase